MQDHSLDDRLTYLARGVYAAMQADPWLNTAPALAEKTIKTTLRGDGVTEGVKAMRRALHELEDHGLVRQVAKPGKRGQLFKVWELTDAPEGHLSPPAEIPSGQPHSNTGEDTPVSQSISSTTGTPSTNNLWGGPDGKTADPEGNRDERARLRQAMSDHHAGDACEQAVATGVDVALWEAHCDAVPQGGIDSSI